MKLREGFKYTTVMTESRGEVRVDYVCAIPKIKSNKGKSVNVEMRPKSSDNPFGGWLFAETSIHNIINKAIEKDTAILLRIEKQRQKGVDVTIPLSELTKTMDDGKKNVRYSVTSVYDFNNSKWINNESISIDPDKDPQELKGFIKYVSEQEIDEDSFFNTPVSQKVPNPSNFEESNILITFYFHLMELEKKYNYSLDDEKRKKFAKNLLIISNAIQKMIKEADVVDYKDYSHTRARFMLFNFEEHQMQLDENNIVEFREWANECIKFCKELIEWSKE